MGEKEKGKKMEIYNYREKEIERETQGKRKEGQKEIDGI